MPKTAQLIYSMTITATRTGSKTQRAAKSGNMMGSKQSTIYFVGMKAKLANRY